MAGMEIGTYLVGLLALVVPLSVGLALWLVAQLRRRSDRAPFAEGMGGTVVPVRRLMRTGRLLGRSQNSINPRLELVEDGLSLKVFKPDHWRFDETAEVDAPWAPFASRVMIRNRMGVRLYADLADRARARDLLRAFPHAVPLTQRARVIRDGG